MADKGGLSRVERAARAARERFRSEAEEYLRPHLQPGERIVAMLAKATTMAVYPFVGLIQLFWMRAYTVVVTDRRVIFLRLGLSKWQPRAIEGEFPREQVHVREWLPKTSRVTGTGLAVLVLDRAGEPLKLRPDPYAGGEELVEALGGVTQRTG